MIVPIIMPSGGGGGHIPFELGASVWIVGFILLVLINIVGVIIHLKEIKEHGYFYVAWKGGLKTDVFWFHFVNIICGGMLGFFLLMSIIFKSAESLQHIIF